MSDNFDFTIEELSMNAWPSLKTVFFDGWIMRLSNGYTNRANSINSIYPGKINLEEKIKYCEEIFSRYGIIPNFKLVGTGSDEPCREQKALNEKLITLNYGINDETSIQVCNELEPCTAKSDGIIVQNDFDNNWKESVIKYNKISEKHWLTFKEMLDKIAVEKIVVSKEVDGRVIGCGFGAVENEWVGVFDMVVKEELRGRGYGRQILQAILARARELGARKSYLQVVLSNSPALHLYRKIGYKEFYRYWYRKKGMGKGAVI